MNKKKFAKTLAQDWPYSAANIQLLLEWMDRGGVDWRQPYYILKQATDFELDLSEVGRILLPTQ